MAPTTASRADAGARAVGALAAVLGLTAGAALLWPRPLADAFFAGWVVVAVGLGLVGGFAAWTGRTALLWLCALLLTALSVVGMWSIGFSIAPAALGLLVAAVLSWRAGPRRESPVAVLEEPPTGPRVAQRTLGGVVAVAVGGSLVYLGAFRRELFGACARETLACALGVTRWDGVALTLLGLAAVGAGGWLVWRQVVIARSLASRCPW